MLVCVVLVVVKMVSSYCQSAGVPGSTVFKGPLRSWEVTRGNSLGPRLLSHLPVLSFHDFYCLIFSFTYVKELLQ